MLMDDYIGKRIGTVRGGRSGDGDDDDDSDE
jgi:hypothetical protein